MVACNTCGAANRDSARFCDRCGGTIFASVPSAHPDPGDSSSLPPIPKDARKGKTLNERFVRIGTLAGRTREEIERVVGQPTSISAMADGALLQWMETRAGFLSASSYHIALTFDNDGICTGVSHEFAS